MNNKESRMIKRVILIMFLIITNQLLSREIKEIYNMRVKTKTFREDGFEIVDKVQKKEFFNKSLFRSKQPSLDFELKLYENNSSYNITLCSITGEEYWTISSKNNKRIDRNCYTSNTGVTLIYNYENFNDMVWLDTNGSIINSFEIDDSRVHPTKLVNHGEFWIVATSLNELEVNESDYFKSHVVIYFFNNQGDLLSSNKLLYNSFDNDIDISSSGTSIFLSNFQEDNDSIPIFHSYMFNEFGEELMSVPDNRLTFGVFSPDEKLYSTQGKPKRLIDIEERKVIAELDILGKLLPLQKGSDLAVIISKNKLYLFNYKTRDLIFKKIFLEKKKISAVDVNLDNSIIKVLVGNKVYNFSRI